jgi:phosphatidylserine/phosphatidylglycerophosphate/cardiolipin synthase-like enzyme
MKRIYGLILAGFCFTQGAVSAHAQDFKAYSVGLYPKPRLVQSNSEALKLRLALLNTAPAGARVRIATFNFDYGTAVETLSAHMCAARKRGVQVELLVDSKSGERAGADDAFDGTKEVKKAEELYQYLANCGVNVIVHNAEVDFVKILGQRLPNIFGAGRGASVNPISLLIRVREIKARLAQVLAPTLRRLGVRSDISDVMDYTQGLVLESRQLMSMAGGDEGPVEQSIEVMSRNYRKLINDPFWNEVNEDKMTEITKAAIEALRRDPELSVVREKVRSYNRLNHRKLFLVETSPGEGCVIIGGRNLGDHYLTDAKDSFHDADVFVCSHHAPAARRLLTEAGASFEDLVHNTHDPMLEDSAPVGIRSVRANPDYKFANVDLRRVALTRVPLNAPVAGIEMNEMRDPRLLTSNWNPRTDEIRMALLEGISREQKEIYIETAYAEFNSSVRRALEKALARGVRVKIVTNGLFISDGASKLIRLWMAPWIMEMNLKYPKTFIATFATLEAGHMIHFKGAGFRCQKGLSGTYRAYILGSHNFHPRSGYSDKEHAVEWREATDTNCSKPSKDMIALRGAYYETLRKKTGVPPLQRYMDLYTELQFVMGQQKDLKSRDLARGLARTLYKYDPVRDEFILNFAKPFSRIENILDESGFRDLVGTLL